MLLEVATQRQYRLEDKMRTNGTLVVFFHHVFFCLRRRDDRLCHLFYSRCLDFPRPDIQDHSVLHSQNLAVFAGLLVVSMIAVPFVVSEYFVPNSMSFAVLAARAIHPVLGLRGRWSHLFE
jgi:hypothetical protein